jgi:site-specific DNA-methyltransferase (cytosine-N4-specific)
MGRDNGGAIPSRVLVAANTNSQDRYQRACRAKGLPVHPARFPEALPDWWIRFLTEEGDQVVDPFAGSLTTAAVASRLGRRWLAIEQSGAYLEGGAERFAA